jgi:hypothetical protein
MKTYVGTHCHETKNSKEIVDVLCRYRQEKRAPVSNLGIQLCDTIQLIKTNCASLLISYFLEYRSKLLLQNKNQQAKHYIIIITMQKQMRRYLEAQRI